MPEHTVGRITFGPIFPRYRRELALIATWKARAERWERLADKLRDKGEIEAADTLSLLADSARMSAEELAEL